MGKVLIVDDEKDVLLLVKAQLKRVGLDVFTTSSGIDALNLLEEVEVDVVVLDVVMPGLSGLDVLRKLKKDPTQHHLKYIVFTALGREVDMMVEPEFKPDIYIRKPFTNETMVNAVSALIC